MGRAGAEREIPSRTTGLKIVYSTRDLRKRQHSLRRRKKVARTFLTPWTKGSPSILDAEDKNVARAFLPGQVLKKHNVFQ